MRDAEVTKDLRDEILGHSHQNTGDTYGKGFALNNKLRSINRALEFLTETKKQTNT